MEISHKDTRGSLLILMYLSTEFRFKQSLVRFKSLQTSYFILFFILSFVGLFQHKLSLEFSLYLGRGRVYNGPSGCLKANDRNRKVIKKEGRKLRK